MHIGRLIREKHIKEHDIHEHHLHNRFRVESPLLGMRTTKLHPRHEYGGNRQPVKIFGSHRMRTL